MKNALVARAQIVAPLLALCLAAALCAAAAFAQDVPRPGRQPAQAPQGPVQGNPAPDNGENAAPAGDAASQSAQKSVIMDFDGVDIRTFIKFISELTGKNFIVGDEVRGEVTILSPESVTVDEAFKVFQSVLEVNGFTIVPQGGMLKIVSAKTGKTMNLETMGSGLGKRPGDRMVTKIIALKNANPTDLRGILGPMVSPDGLIVDYPQSGSLILIDYAPNVERLAGIIADMDVRSAQMTVFNLEYANAKSMSERIQNLWGAGQAKGGAKKAFAVVPDERVNKLVVMATPEELSEIAALISELDQPTQKSSGNFKVYALQNANAEDLAKVLTELVSVQKTPTAEGAPKEFISSGVKIVADKSTNSLLVTAAPEDFVFFDDLVTKLDLPRKQVYVEALIMEVSADKGISFGVNWSAATNVQGIGDAKDGGLAFGSYQPTDTYNPISDGVLTPSTGFSVGMVTFPVQIGDIIYSNLQAMLSASSTTNNFNIISTPQLMTMDNEEATITVAENRPYLTASDSGQNELDRTYQKFEYKDVGTTLKVTPQINKGDAIRLKVMQEVSRVDKTETLETGALQPTTRKRSTETTVLVHNGQTIVISGLIGETSRDGLDKVPLLGDIPGLGWLFKQKSREAEKTNLFVFITPRIAENPADSDDLFRKKVNALEKASNEELELSFSGPLGESPQEYITNWSDSRTGIPPVEKPMSAFGPIIKE